MEQVRLSEECARGRVRSVNVSKRKGGRKTPCEGGGTVEAHFGVAGDAHAGDWHRQVSLLAWESIEKAQAMGLDVAEGDFAENVTTEGIDLLALPLGSRLRVGDSALLELSQIGKVCHTKCAIYHLAGDCIFPREGVFFVALEDGEVKPGDSIEVVELGDGMCAYTPPEALEELRAARER
ncbi:sulfurase [Gordonibacter sp. 28C]|uniref:MOSC domain-containing protein n=1 Tax=Gordonibacter sp. 28C TaxID=2078569 RepID=UPI000DF77920|nr:MOSC domain-containing protein [Gordonibacter sp. 28C]RDB64475.1 sulfurase [Gordonibacter sp. 28C]